MALKLADWSAIAEIALAVIALLALVGAAIQIIAARLTSRETLTYNQGLLHKGITKDFFGLTALDVWNRGSWFIERSRKSNAGYYRQWELMLEDMDLLSPSWARAPVSA